MAHAANMRDALPQLYKDGELVNQLLALLALPLEIADEDALEVQRSHWFDHALEREEAVRLGALLNVPAESWQSLPQYRDWVHSLRNAMLRHGSITRTALQDFLSEYTGRFQQTAGFTIPFPLRDWQETPSRRAPAFIENPVVRRTERAPADGGIEPLHRFTIVNRGLDEAKASFLMVGLPRGPESVPVIVNLTTGQALVLLDQVPTGARLWIRPNEDGSVTATLEGRNVTAAMFSVSGVTPGKPWLNTAVERPPRAITLRRGENELWFLTVAHFNARGLDRFLLSLADLSLEQGRFDEAELDHALFYQDPAVSLKVTWLETRPASFRAQIPGGALRYPRGDGEQAIRDRDLLQSSLVEAVDRLRPAGVEAEVSLRPFQDLQPLGDRLMSVGPKVVREVGPTGADSLPDSGGLFEVTRFEDSTYR